MYSAPEKDILRYTFHCLRLVSNSCSGIGTFVYKYVVNGAHSLASYVCSLVRRPLFSQLILCFVTCMLAFWRHTLGITSHKSENDWNNFQAVQSREKNCLMASRACILLYPIPHPLLNMQIKIGADLVA